MRKLIIALSLVLALGVGTTFAQTKATYYKIEYFATKLDQDVDWGDPYTANSSYMKVDKSGVFVKLEDIGQALFIIVGQTGSGTDGIIEYVDYVTIEGLPIRFMYNTNSGRISVAFKLNDITLLIFLKDPSGNSHNYQENSGI